MSAYYNEHDPFAAQWLRNLIDAGLIASGDVDERSICDIDASELVGYKQWHFFAGIGVWSAALRGAGWPDDREVCTGSCPCQPWSNAGRNNGFNDERHLWPDFFRIIRELRPRTVFGEQVASRSGLAWLDAVSADLEGAGYAIGAVDTCAAGFGAPHIRQRLYFVADTDLHGTGRATGGQAGEARPLEGACGSAGQAGAGAGTLAGVRGASGELADAADLGHDGRGTGQAGSRAIQPQRLRDVGGFWADADWLYCRDGKHRAVEPGSQPLAHGATQRVGRLRAYGNALCEPQAQEFIAAYMSLRRYPCKAV